MSMVIRQLQGLKALVVDDDANSFKLVQAVLEISGIESTCASSVYEALAVYKSLQPDILIADLEMPDKDGFFLIRKIRALSLAEGGEVPAIALTISSSIEVRLQAKKLGFQECIAKPFNIYYLLASVTELLQLSEKERATVS